MKEAGNTVIHCAESYNSQGRWTESDWLNYTDR